MGTYGIILGMAVLIFLVYKGYHLLPTTILVSVIILVTNSVGIWEGLSKGYAAGLGAFVSAYGLMLLFGALFGQIMADTGCAKAMANKIIGLAGYKYIVLLAILITSVLVYGGLATYVIIFTVFPITRSLFDNAKLPQALNCAAIGLGAGTYTMTALPFSPSVQNIIPTTYLGTDVAAAPLMGIVCGVLMFVLGYAIYTFGALRSTLPPTLRRQKPSRPITRLSCLAKICPTGRWRCCQSYWSL